MEHIIDVKVRPPRSIASPLFTEPLYRKWSWVILHFWNPEKLSPCDGIFLSGHNVKCDELAATGETDAIKKAPYSYCIERRNMQSPQKEGPSMSHTDCFIISGSKVLEGIGCYVVVTVGTKSFNGRIMMGMFFQCSLLVMPSKSQAGSNFVYRYGEHPSSAQTEHSCRIYCQSWKCSRHNPFYCAHDKILCSTWHERSLSVSRSPFDIRVPRSDITFPFFD